MPCPFCDIDDDRIVASNALAVAIRDRYPVSPGHTLVVSRRHVASWCDASPDERQALMHLVDETMVQLDRQPDPPHGYNVGINVGEAAGQTIMHLHVHLVPRYHGDVEDPRGGVRFVVPEKGRYPFDESRGA